jgi:hypothetical protein
MKRLSIIAAIIIIIALFAWAPWMSEASAKDSVNVYFEKQNKGIVDGCGFNCDGCGIKSAEKIAFGYAVEVEYACGLLPADSKQYHTTRTFKVYSFGVTKEIVPKTEQPPTTAPATPALTISNFNFGEVETGAADFTYMTTLAASPTPNMLSFEGPIILPDPCRNLTANYSVQGNTVVVNITAIPTAEMCIQVIKNTFYKGSFEYIGTLDSLIINYQGQEIGGYPTPD